MDWRYVQFAAVQGIPALLGLAATLPIFAYAATANRRLRASSASLASACFFVASCLVAGLPGVEASQLVWVLPLAGLVATLALIVPSILALRWRWLGLLHLVTLAAAAYLGFISSLAIGHDGT